VDSPAIPAPDEVRAQLQRVLAAGPLASAGRLSRLLTYVVERTLAGEGNQLKEYVLGTEVFDRPAQYDPRLDSIVRVEARRLRAKLEDYYQGPGASDPIVIDIPRGSYVPIFRLATGLRPQEQPSAEPPGTPLRPAEGARVRSTPPLRVLVVGAFLAGMISVIIFAGLQSRPGSSTAPQASSVPSIAVLPFHHYSLEAVDQQLARRLTDGVTTELARTGRVSVASRTSAAQYIGEARPLKEIAAALAVDFILESSAVREGDMLVIETRLVDGVVDRKFWVGQYRQPVTAVQPLARLMASEIAAAAIARKAR
jgi:adenylate cyclase